MINILGSLSNKWNDSGISDSENPILITSCGYQKFISRDYSISRPKGRLDYQIIYIVKGKGSYTLDGKTTELSAGNIILYPPHTAQIYSYSSEDQTELYWIHLTGSSIGDYLHNLNLLDSPVHYVGIHNLFSELFEKIIYELQIKNLLFQYVVAGYFLELISNFARKKVYLKSNTPILISEDIQKVIETMYKHYNQNYTVEHYARLCNLSLYRFIHKFKQYTGMSPLEYLTSIRINTARDLLINSGFNISEIATLVGYDNPLYFSRVFKKSTGICPSKYKKG